jgi:hypothetical protein
MAALPCTQASIRRTTLHCAILAGQQVQSRHPVRWVRDVRLVHTAMLLVLKMANPFFDHPILNSPYSAPRYHWELDEHGQPTQQIVEARRCLRGDSSP